MTTRLIVLLVSTFLLSSCRRDPQPLLPEEKQEIIPLIHHEAFIVTVDNLRMRNRPGRKSEVMRKLPEGSIVLSEGIISDFTEEVTLRGKAYDEPYHKVYLRNKEDRQGWVYGGALLKIYYDQTAYPFSSYIDGLVTGIANRDIVDIDDMQATLSEIMQETTDVPEWNDALLTIALNYLEPATTTNKMSADVAKLLGDSIDQVRSELMGGKSDYANTATGQTLRNSGLRLVARSSSVTPQLDVARVTDLIAGPYSAAGQAYVDIERRLSTATIADQGYTVTTDLVDTYNSVEQYLSTFDKRTIFYKRVADHHQVLHSAIKRVTSLDSAIKEYISTKYPDSQLAKSLGSS